MLFRSQIFSSKIISKLVYASPSWWGFISASSKHQLEAFVNRVIKFGFYPPNHISLAQIIEVQESNLFRSIVDNSNHCLHYLLPPKRQVKYDLRKRGHDFALPPKDDRNFIDRSLYKYI